MIPFLNLRAQVDELRAELDAAIARVLHSGVYILGPEVESFEAEWAAFCEARHCVGVGNGLDALTLSLLAMGIGEGDEVIVPSNTYIATWLAVSHCGAKPIPVEPIEETSNIDPEKIERAITSRTRAVIAVHLYGQPAHLAPILEITRRHGIRLLEDAAQAHGARYQSRRIGAHGDAVAWSFYPGKNLGALGDAGAVTTDDEQIAGAVRILRNYGSHRKYVNSRLGFNSRLDPIQAAVLRVKLKHLDEWNQRRRVLAHAYGRALDGLALQLPEVIENVEPVWHLYAIRSTKRDLLQQTLERAGIGTLIHYPIPPHLQEAYASLGLSNGSLPIAERLAQQVLSLPISPHHDPELPAAVGAALRPAL